MPIYEYECNVCEKTCELWQSINSPAPTCCNTTMNKLISNNTFRLKGNGWYVTDYKNTNRKAVGKDNGK